MTTNESYNNYVGVPEHLVRELADYRDELVAANPHPRVEWRIGDFYADNGYTGQVVALGGLQEELLITVESTILDQHMKGGVDVQLDAFTSKVPRDEVRKVERPEWWPL